MPSDIPVPAIHHVTSGNSNSLQQMNEEIDFERDLGMSNKTPSNNIIERASSPLEEIDSSQNQLRMNSLQINLKANSMLNVIPTDKGKDGAPGSLRKTMPITDQPNLVRHSTEEEMKVSGMSDKQSSTPVFSRPVDQLRKSKVEARQAKRNMFRDRLEKQKFATGDKILQ